MSRDSKTCLHSGLRYGDHEYGTEFCSDCHKQLGENEIEVLELRERLGLPPGLNPPVLPPEAEKEWPAPMPIDLTTALAEVVNELKRAQELYPRPFVNAHEAHSIIQEEFQEVENIIYVKHKDRNSAMLRNELVQLAAMCIRTLIEVDAHAP